MSEEIAAKPYTIVYEDYSNYLYALVHGEEYGYDVLAGFLREIADECKKRNFKQVLIEENISATASQEDVFRIASELPEFGFADIRMAYIDRFLEQKELNEFGHDVAVDHGVDVQIFGDIESGKQLAVTTRMNEYIIQYDLEIFLRLLIVTVLAGVLGWERESSGKAAGLRTHILVGIACVLFVVIGQFMSESFADLGPHVRFDIANLLGAIVTGVSFLGAGVIFFRRGEDRDVNGLTTAAGILATAAIAILVGLQKYVLAVGSTLIVFFVLRFVNMIEIKAQLKADKSVPLETSE